MDEGDLLRTLVTGNGFRDQRIRRRSPVAPEVLLEDQGIVMPTIKSGEQGHDHVKDAEHILKLPQLPRAAAGSCHSTCCRTPSFDSDLVQLRTVHRHALEAADLKIRIKTGQNEEIL
jgi:hypothetical protein